MLLHLFIPCTPTAQPRPRVVTINGQARAISAPRKHPVNAFKQAVQSHARITYKGEPTAEALSARALFLMPRPQALTWKKKAMPRLWHTGRPDTENIAKALLDALTGIVWVDDSQVAQLVLQKKYAAGDEEPGVWLIVEVL